MYPFIRLIKDLILARRMPALEDPLATHVSHHICWPHDLDFAMELNNGRTLTLYDLGRIGLALRIGLIRALRREKWGMTMAGSCVRYRRRVRCFDRFEARSRVVCWDDRFTYLEQSMWKRDGECASHVVFRVAITDNNGLVSPHRIPEALGNIQPSPPMPEWIAKWVEAEANRPWPPMQDA